MRRFIAGVALLIVGAWLVSFDDGVVRPVKAQLTTTGAGCATASCGGTAPISPSSFGANLVAWYKADTGVFTDTGCSSAAANGNSVLCWTDQSGNGYNITNSVGSAQPTYNTTGLNSSKTVTGALNNTGLGTGGQASATFPITQLESLSKYTLFLVMVFPTSNNFPRVMNIAPGTNDQGAGSLIVANANNPETFMQFAGGGGFDGIVYTGGTAYALFETYDGTTSTPYVNGVAQATSTPSITWSASPSGLSLFQNLAGSAAGANVSISEFYLLNTNINSTQATGSYAYLKPRWGLP